MTNTKNEAQAVRCVVQRYVEFSDTGDVEALKTLFHPNALMSGYLMGELGIGSTQPFFEAVTNVTPDNSSEYVAEIGAIEVAGNAASATLVEKNFLGMNFVDYFHLIKEDGEWRIVSKTFNQGD